MRRLFPTSLRAQLLLLILAALVVAQGLSLWLFVDERSLAVRAALGQEAAGRAANVARLLEEAPMDLRPSILRAANSPLVRFSLDGAATVAATSHSNERSAQFIQSLVGADPAPEVRVAVRQVAPSAAPPTGVPERMMLMHQAMQNMSVTPVSMQISIAISSGEWLNVVTRFNRPPNQLAWTTAASFAVTALLIAAALWLALGRLILPIRRLADASDSLGRGEDVAELELTGPEELRRLTAAFNRMQTRLRRFVEDRTRLLGALGHDLRSPLTALRVRAEMVDDPETRERLVSTIEEMQEMVSATLSFARGMATTEPVKTVELRGLVADLVAEHAETGGAVTLAPEGADGVVRIRPLAMRRALRNLIENALRYGNLAQVAIERDAGAVHVIVRDTGPGIPAADLEKVFDPFVRLEVSRSRETGGTGLGLSIVRTIVHAHGGEVTLSNADDGGLVARVTLPLAEM